MATSGKIDYVAPDQRPTGLGQQKRQPLLIFDIRYSIQNELTVFPRSVGPFFVCFRALLRLVGCCFSMGPFDDQMRAMRAIYTIYAGVNVFAYVIVLGWGWGGLRR